MTISSTNRKAGPYAGDNVTVSFPFAFKVFKTADVYVVRADALGAETVLTLTTDYTVTLNADQNANPGGTVTLLAALASGYTLTLSSSLDYLQPTDLTNQGGFYPKVIADALDRLTIFCQQLYEQLSRSLKLAISVPPGVKVTLPVPVPYQVLGWDSSGQQIVNVDPSYATALSGDLANNTDATKGAALVGIYDPVAPAYLKTVSDLLSGEPVNLLRNIPKTEWAAIAAGTSTYNSAPRINELASAVAEGGIIDLPPGLLMIQGSMVFNKGVWLRAQRGSANAANGAPTAMKTLIKWDSGTPGDKMIVWKSANAGEAINRGGILGVMLDGNNTATTGLHASSAAFSEFDVTTYRTVSNGCVIDDGNGVLTNGIVFRKFEHFCGSNIAAWSANGMLIDGDVAGLFATSVTCDWFEAEIVNGHGLTFRAVDSCDFRRAKIYTRSGSGGVGFHTRFLKSTNYPTFHAQKNRIGMQISGGNIYFGDYTKNNIIDCCIAESGQIVYESDAANKRTNHVSRLIDFRDGSSWATHQFKLSDYRNIALGDFVGFGTTAALTTVGALAAGRAWSFSATATNGISASNLVPVDWNDGFLRGIRLTLNSVGSATGNAVFQISGVSRAVGAGTGGFQQVVQATLTPAQSATNTSTQHEILFGSEIITALGGWWGLAIERLGADAADTYPNAVHVIGVELIYRAEGPDSAGTYGPYGRFLIGGSDANP